MELPDLGEDLHPVLARELDVDDRQPGLFLRQRSEEIVPVDMSACHGVTGLGKDARQRIPAERLSIE